MQKDFCDMCKEEVLNIIDLKFINITDTDKKPVTPQREVCVSCKEKVLQFIKANTK